MCPECDGIGKTVQFDLDRFLDRGKSLNGGAILHPELRVGKLLWKTYTLSGLFDNDKPIKDYNDEDLHALPYCAGTRVLFGEIGLGYLRYEGLVQRFNRMYIEKDAATMSDRNRAVFEEFTTAQTCPLCRGVRLNQAALSCVIRGRSIADLSDLEASELIEFLEQLEDPIAVKVAAGLIERLRHMVDIGLGYLSLSRETAIQAARHLEALPCAWRDCRARL